MLFKLLKIVQVQHSMHTSILQATQHHPVRRLLPVSAVRISPMKQATGTQYVSLLRSHWFNSLLFHTKIVKATTTLNTYSPS
jgi:hypothetical protein